MTSPPPLIAIGFFGLPRAMHLSMPGIRQHILEPAGRLGRVVTCHHLFQQDWVQNPRSGENLALDASNYGFFDPACGELEPPDGIPERAGLEALKQRGDVWEDGFVSLRNLLLQLHSLHRVTERMAALQPDIAVFVRPDLIYQDSLEAALRHMLQPGQAHSVSLPEWQWSLSGYNDRFAICGRHAMAAYGQRGSRLAEYLAASQRPVHGESLLRFALDTACLSVLPLATRASRVRANGEVRQENFSRPKWRRVMRWRLREQAKLWLRQF